MRCKVGDLAYQVVGDENLGRVFEVISFYMTHLRYGPIWNVRSQEKINVYDGYTQAALPPSTEFHCPDSWLRPISGVPIVDDVRDEVPA